MRINSFQDCPESKKPLEKEGLKDMVRDPETNGETLDQIAHHYTDDVELMKTLMMHPNLKPQSLLFLYNNSTKDLKIALDKLKEEKISNQKDLIVSTAPQKSKKPDPKKSRDSSNTVELVKEKPINTFQRIQTMNVSEKVQFALKGGRDARSVLLKDSNRLVYSAVLASPKITEDEIHLIAQSRNVSDDILRSIAKNKEWMKKYSIMHSITTNPKTPLGISLALLPRISLKDLAALSKSRNIPEAIRSTAGRLHAAKKKNA